MTKTKGKLRIWSKEALALDVKQALTRVLHVTDVRLVAAMPDVHLAKRVCVGAVVATGETLLPQAVGGDIGCGMAAISLGCDADVLQNGTLATRIFAMLQEVIPIANHRQAEAQLPSTLFAAPLSSPRLESKKATIARSQFATLGRGNHFVELQRDSENILWCMVHSGSRGIGQGIAERHTGGAERLVSLSAASEAGQEYLSDMHWALDYAKLSRDAMLKAVVSGLRPLLPELEVGWHTQMDCHHNFVRREIHEGQALWVHRKGAISAQKGEPGIIPGSMGTCSFHVSGRGESSSLCSSSHGAGRVMSRGAALRKISTTLLQREMKGVWFQRELSRKLCDEAPSAYKDIGQVMRAQKDLTKIKRKLLPVLVYKGV